MSDPAGISTPSPDQKLAEAELTASGSYARSLGGGRKVTMAITPTALVIRGPTRETMMPLDSIRLVRVGRHYGLYFDGSSPPALWLGRKGDNRLARFHLGEGATPLLEALCPAVLEGVVEAGGNRIAIWIIIAMFSAVAASLLLLGVVLALSRVWVGSLFVLALATIGAWSAGYYWMQELPRRVQGMSELRRFL